MEHLRRQLKRGAKSLASNRGYRRYRRLKHDSRFEIDEERLHQEAQFDGLWVLRTNLKDDAEQIAHSYKMLWMAEGLIRTAKTILETRPIYHKRDETIRGHVFCSFLALRLKVDLEKRLEARGENWEWAEVIRGLDRLEEIAGKFRGRRYLMRSQLRGDACAAIRAAGVALPPTIREA